jgi:transcriptional regulator with XRE-family HTH domain
VNAKNVGGDTDLLLPLPQLGRQFTGASRSIDAEAARLKAQGLTLSEIAGRLGMADEHQVASAIKRALGTMARFAKDELRLMELRSLDELEWVAWKTLQSSHVVISQGKIIRGDDGTPLEDDRFALEVVDRILKIKERRSKLWGLDAPTRSEVVTIDSIESEIEKLERELDASRTR